MSNSSKFDIGKLRFDLIPSVLEEGLATILTYGARKYGPNNWQELPDFEDRYYAALRRHLSAWRQGEDYDLDEPGFDPETYDPNERNQPQPGSHTLHILQVFCNAGFLAWYSIKKRGLKIRLTETEVEKRRSETESGD